MPLLKPDWTLSGLCELPDQRGSGKRFPLGGLGEFLQAGAMRDVEAVDAEGVDRELVIMCPMRREGANVGLDLFECWGFVAGTASGSELIFGLISATSQCT
jgi:hypothetical protein